MHAVQAAREVFQPEVTEVVAAGDQEVILGIVASPEQGTRLPHHPSVQARHLAFHLERVGRFRGDVEIGLGVRSRLQLHRGEVLAGDQRAVDQVVETDRFEGDERRLRPLGS